MTLGHSVENWKQQGRGVKKQSGINYHSAFRFKCKPSGLWEQLT